MTFSVTERLVFRKLSRKPTLDLLFTCFDFFVTIALVQKLIYDFLLPKGFCSSHPFPAYWGHVPRVFQPESSEHNPGTSKHRGNYRVGARCRFETFCGTSPVPSTNFVTNSCPALIFRGFVFRHPGFNVGACVITKKILDRQSCIFKLSLRFPRKKKKQSFGTILLSVPTPKPPQKYKFWFYFFVVSQSLNSMWTARLVQLKPSAAIPIPKSLLLGADPLAGHPIANANRGCNRESVNRLMFLQASPPIALYPQNGPIANSVGVIPGACANFWQYILHFVAFPKRETEF